MIEKKKQPLVSIAVITYCSEGTILETLESIRKQTYANIELIISDDASTDNTVNICKLWIKEYDKRFVRTELITVANNTGTSANINRSIKSCKGIYRKAIAGDDILEPDCIQINVDNIGNADFAFSDITYFSSKGILKYTPDVLVLRSLTRLSPQKRIKLFAQSMPFCNTPSWFERMDIYDKVGLYDETNTIFEDVPFLTRLLSSSEIKIRYIEQPTVRYRSGGISHNKKSYQRIQLMSFKIYKKYCRPHLTYKSFIDLVTIINNKIWGITISLNSLFLLRCYNSRFNFLDILRKYLIRRQLVNEQS